MLSHRVIPILLLRERGLVKTTRFKDPQYVGDPVNAIRIFNEKEVDELVLLDITRGAAGLGPDFETVRDVASECFMPLAYGGGISSLEQAAQLFALGVEKVVLRTAAANDPGLVTQIADFGGTQSVAVCLDVARSRLGRRRLHCPGTRWHKSEDWLGVAHQMVDHGAGELIVQSVDRDGTGSGLDVDLIRTVAEAVSVPVVAVGGVGGLGDLKAGVAAGASAVGAGSLFVFHGPRRAVLITYPDYAELEVLLGKAAPR